MRLGPLNQYGLKGSRYLAALDSRRMLVTTPVVAVDVERSVIFIPDSL